MGHRLTKIYTRTGDDGSTGLADGNRVEKDSLRVDAIGDIDELNSLLGVLAANDIPDDIKNITADAREAANKESIDRFCNKNCRPINIFAAKPM